MAVGLVGLVMVIGKVNLLYVIIMVLVAMVVVPWLVEKFQRRRLTARYGNELDEPFLAEVVLDGTAVATLSAREITEMFWRRYRITPLSHEAAAIIADDALWEQCKFTFRDPASGRVCRAGFAGGSAPFVRNGHVSLRGLYFQANDTKPEHGASPNGGPAEQRLQGRSEIIP